jgi:hypothetical protein
LTQVVIENPAINSPVDEPRRHFKFSDEGIQVGQHRLVYVKRQSRHNLVLGENRMRPKPPVGPFSQFVKRNPDRAVPSSSSGEES